MRIDRLLLEGRCTCGSELEIDDAPDPKSLPMLADMKKRCANMECRRVFYIHIQETLPLI